MSCGFLDDFGGVNEEKCKAVLGHAAHGADQVVTAVIMGIIEADQSQALRSFLYFHCIIDQHFDAELLHFGNPL